MSSIRSSARRKYLRVTAAALTTALFFFLAPVYRAYAISAISFAEPVGYQTGVWQDVRSATTADIDNDGDQDLISGVFNGVVQARLNDGTGTFGPIISSAVGGNSEVWWVTTGDFNGDTHVDVAVANFWEQQLQVMFGDGTGNFTAQTPIPLGDDQPLQVIAADFNDDGHLDLAAAGKKINPTDDWRGMFSVALNNGDGTFAASTNTSTQAYYGSRGIASADIDDDGKLDLLVGQNNSKYYGGYGHDVGVFLGDGSGSFTHSTDLNVAIGVRGIQVADLDDDGHADLIATWRNAWYTQYHGTSVMLGHGDGTFGSATLLDGSLDPISDITIATTADFNADGALDILVPANSQKETQVFAGDGHGGFGAPVNTSANPYSASVYSAVPADVNDDGLPDIVTGNHGWTFSGTDIDSSAGVNLNTTVVEVAPQITGVPTVTGNPLEDQVLSAHTDSLVVTGDPTPDTSLQWQVSDDGHSDWSDIPSATGTAFTLTGDQVGKYVRLLFKASNSVGDTQVASSATAQVMALPTPTPTPSPTPSRPFPPQLAQACPTGNCTDADLRGIDLAGLDLRGIDFSGAQLQGANLRGADLRGTDLRGADLRNADLRSTDLRSADLVKANLVGADLRKADLRKANLRQARLSTRIVRGDVAGFRGANLRSADMRGANLTGAHLAGSDLRQTDLRRATATRADLRNINAKHATFKHAKLTRADFSWANLSFANFTDANLNKTRFDHANTTGAKFSSAH